MRFREHTLSIPVILREPDGAQRTEGESKDPDKYVRNQVDSGNFNEEPRTLLEVEEVVVCKRKETTGYRNASRRTLPLRGACSAT